MDTKVREREVPLLAGEGGAEKAWCWKNIMRPNMKMMTDAVKSL
jgi:hypothetical protein